jgi:hypothetical protein
MRRTEEELEAEQEAEIARIDAGGSAVRRGDKLIVAEVKKPLDMVVPIRISSEHWRELRAEAAKVGVGPSTLARMWLLERLRQSEASAPPPRARARRPARVSR